MTDNCGKTRSSIARYSSCWPSAFLPTGWLVFFLEYDMKRSDHAMSTIIEKCLKFWFHYTAMGLLAMIIIYASVDAQCFLATGQSPFMALWKGPAEMGEEAVSSYVKMVMERAFQAIPDGTFFNDLLKISFGDEVGEILYSATKFFQSGNVISQFTAAMQNHAFFWKDMASASSASLVFYALDHLKDKTKEKKNNNITAWFGFVLVSGFWLLAGCSFAKTITEAVPLIVPDDMLTYAYILITIAEGIIEVIFHACSKKNCSFIGLLFCLCCQILLFTPIRNTFMLFMCRIIASFTHEQTFTIFHLQAITISAAIIITVIILEGKLKSLAENFPFPQKQAR